MPSPRRPLEPPPGEGVEIQPNRSTRLDDNGLNEGGFMRRRGVLIGAVLAVLLAGVMVVQCSAEPEQSGSAADQSGKKAEKGALRYERLALPKP